MKKLKFLTLAASIAAVSLGSSFNAVADHHGAKMKAKMEKIDTNQDGMISKSEYLANAEEKFAKMDANGDGNLSQDEAQAAKKAKYEKKMMMKEKWQHKKSETTE